MNIKINKEQAEYIFSREIARHTIGSKLYGTYNEESDTDILIIYDSFHDSDLYYPNYHQFQYDADNIQYIFTTERHFWQNLFSGDSIINADIILSGDDDFLNNKLNVLRTYNVIKSFIGFAKRDIKSFEQGKGKNKIFHANRCLYCAEKLLNNELPILEILPKLETLDIQQLKEKEQKLRAICNKQFEDNLLTKYPKKPIINPINKLEEMLIEANNIKEFKY